MMRPLPMMLALLCALGLLPHQAKCAPCCGGEPSKQACCCCGGGEASQGECGQNELADTDDQTSDAPVAAAATSPNPIHVVGRSCCCTPSERPIAAAWRAEPIIKRPVREVPGCIGTFAAADALVKGGALTAIVAKSHPPPLPARTRRAVLCVYTI